jgi:hypothetical protein
VWSHAFGNAAGARLRVGRNRAAHSARQGRFLTTTKGRDRARASHCHVANGRDRPRGDVVCLEIAPAWTIAFTPAPSCGAASLWRPSATPRRRGASHRRASRRSGEQSGSASASSPERHSRRGCRSPHDPAPQQAKHARAVRKAGLRNQSGDRPAPRQEHNRRHRRPGRRRTRRPGLARFHETRARTAETCKV